MRLLSDGEEGRTRKTSTGFPPPIALGWTKARADTRVRVRAAARAAVGETMVEIAKSKNEHKMCFLAKDRPLCRNNSNVMYECRIGWKR